MAAADKCRYALKANKYLNYKQKGPAAGGASRCLHAERAVCFQKIRCDYAISSKVGVEEAAGVFLGIVKVSSFNGS